MTDLFNGIFEAMLWGALGGLAGVGFFHLSMRVRGLRRSQLFRKDWPDDIR